MKAEVMVKQLADAFNFLSNEYRIFVADKQQNSANSPLAVNLEVFYLGDKQTPISQIASVQGLDNALSAIIEHNNEKT